MAELFQSLSHAIEGSWPLALSGAFVWGVLSIVLSPCHLSSIPLIVGFIGGQGRIPTRRAALLATLFSLGMLLTIAVLGVATAGAGRILGDLGRTGNWLLAGIFLIVGLHLLGVIPFPGGGISSVGIKRRGPLAAFLLGFIFGIALGPCTFAFIAPMLAVAFRAGGEDMFFASLLLLSYGIGHTLLIALAGTFTEVVQRTLNWNEGSRGLDLLRKVCGLLVVFGGLYLLWTSR
ncbi:cytochrome C biogenesis protein [bacterium]|nr:cytochrome C biogenesis protein [bacterium]